MVDSSIEMFLVGGAVRDMAKNVKIHDLDFTVVAPSFSAMKFYLEDSYQVKFFLEKPEFGTLRGIFPKKYDNTGLPNEKVFFVENPSFAGIDLSGVACDFVLARKEGYYADGRHPDNTEPGTLYDDLSRRDFTVNAIAISRHGDFVDPFRGLSDIDNNVLRAVGNPFERLLEDPLRVLRAIRFKITKGFQLGYPLEIVMDHPAVISKLKTSVSIERIREELDKCFRVSTIETIIALDKVPHLRNWLYEHELLWLKPTTEKR